MFPSAAMAAVASLALGLLPSPPSPSAISAAAAFVHPTSPRPSFARRASLDGAAPPLRSAPVGHIRSGRPLGMMTSAASAVEETSVHVDDARLVESDNRRVLPSGVRVLHSVRAMSGSRGDGGELCRGALIRRPALSKGDDDGNGDERVPCEIILSAGDRDDDVGSEGGGERVRMGAAAAAARALDALLIRHLLLERDDAGEREREVTVVIDGDGDGASGSLARAAEGRGFRSIDPHRSGGDDGKALTFALDPPEAVRRYTELAFAERGTEAGLAALEILSLLSAHRVPYRFEDSDAELPITGVGRGLVASRKQVLPTSVVSGISDIVSDIERRGWLSTNPDSVDGLPSLHLNLISGGKLMFSSDDDSDKEKGNPAIRKSVLDMVSLIRPHLYDEFLPEVRSMMNSSAVYISDVFIRRYGEDIQPDGNGGTRYGISAHYDVTSAVTSVVALDDVAAGGRSGLYAADGASDHASLRRFFPLGAGDGVVHTWDVLHGVEINPGESRTSLIVWFTDGDGDAEGEGASSPWLADPAADDDVGQFVLASATESTISTAEGNDSLMESDRTSVIMNLMMNDGVAPMEPSRHPHDLYLASAELGNAFALTRLGGLCDDSELTSDRMRWAASILRKLRPAPVDGIPSVPINSDVVNPKVLSMGLYYEGAVRGNPLAQTSLADSLMEASMSALSSNPLASAELRLMASVLFGLAAQQGHGGAREALSRVMGVEASIAEEGGRDEAEVTASPVFQTARAAAAATLMRSGSEDAVELEGAR